MTDNTKALRTLLQVEIDTGIAYRQARGQKFLELVKEGELHPVIWKELESDLELIELERESLMAAADVKVALWETKGERRPAPRALGLSECPTCSNIDDLARS